MFAQFIRTVLNNLEQEF